MACPAKIDLDKLPLVEKMTTNNLAHRSEALRVTLRYCPRPRFLYKKRNYIQTTFNAKFHPSTKMRECRARLASLRTKWWPSTDLDQSDWRLVDASSDRVLSKMSAVHTKEDAYAIISASRGQWPGRLPCLATTFNRLPSISSWHEKTGKLITIDI